MKPEHRLQVAVRKWVRECVMCPHLFLAFDRSRNFRGAHGGSTHLAEKARGILSGTPDTCLLTPICDPWVELKAGSNKPTEDQIKIGQLIIEAGGTWDWTNSVVGYCTIVRDCGIPLAGLAEVRAADLDARLSVPSVPKSPTARKPRPPRAAASTIRRLNAARSKGGILF